MWRLRIKLKPEQQLLGTLAIKHGVSLAGYTFSSLKHKKNLHVILSGIVFGESENKKEFLKELQTQPDFIEGEVQGDFAIIVLRYPLYSAPIFSPKIIRPTPSIINKNGYHLWDFASFDREVLEKVIAFVQKYLQGEILSFREENITNISITSILPELTKHQKAAMEIAINKGYYEYPKKITLEELAEIIGVSYSTYQEHLKKAESKIVPFIYKQL
jgi:predicted DNA binding protein